MKKELMFGTLYCQCYNGHIWTLAIPKYWFNVRECYCPACGNEVYAMRVDEPQTLGGLTNDNRNK